MARTSTQDVTEAELAVMQSLWDQGATTIRAVTDDLYPGGRTSHYATVQKLLERLEAKEYVSRERAGGVNVYAAAVDRDELIGRRLRNVAAQLCGGSLTPILTHLVRAKKLTSRERQELRDLIESMEQKRTG